MPRKTYSTQSVENYSEIVTIYADYIISEINKGNSPSIRAVAEHFKTSSRKELVRSHVTIYKLLTEVLPIIDYQKYMMIKKLFDKNNDRKKSIEETKIRIRVFNIVGLLLNDFTIDEIVKFYNQCLSINEEPITYDIAYRDLTVRFKIISQEEGFSELYEEVQKRLSENSLSNLAYKNNNLTFNYYINQARDEHGKFKK